MTSRLRFAAHVVGIAALILLPFWFGPYGHFILATVMVYGLVSLSLNILVGMAGQISIGHAGFWAIGAYTSAVAVETYGVPFVLALCLAGAVTGVCGAIVALPALRVQGHYLAIATLAFALVAQQVLFEWESVTGGRQGMFVSRPSLVGYELTFDLSLYYFLLALFLAAAWMTRNLRLSLTGRSLMAMRMSPIAAQCSGIHRARMIILAFTLSAVLTGVSGAVYGALIGRLSTETFSLGTSLAFLTMAVIGGLGSEVGALLGAIFLALAPEMLRQLQDAQMVVYGIILILTVQFLPNGLVSIGSRLKRLWSRS